VPAKKPQGVILFLCALFLFAATDTTFKYLAAFFVVPLLVWARFIVHLLIMLVVVAPRMGRELIVTRRPGLMILRALVLVVAAILLQLAFKDLPLAETTAIFFVTPLLVALLAGPLLGEQLHLRTWLATLVGFGGVLLIVRPGGAMLGAGVAYTLAAALCNALYQILTRKLAQTEPVMRQIFYTALVGTLVMTPLLPVYWTGEMPTPMQALLIVSLGLFAGIGHFFFIGAFRDTPASTLSPMTFFQLVWVSLLGWAVFGQYPDTLSTLGMLVICASGLSLALKWPRLEFSQRR
jgi:drug/metabolite transporter (DMT)-like permease